MNVTNSFIDFLHGHPYSTEVGALCERATSDKNDTENWALIMEACDCLNASADGPQSAIKAITRRLNADVKNTTIVLYTLTLLETCVKNCGHRFHLLVCSRDFLQELEKIVVCGSDKKKLKYEVPVIVRDRILLLIQTWYDSFKNQSSLRGIEITYKYLHDLGIQFPMINLISMSPIKTPKKSTSSQYSQEALKSAPLTVLKTVNIDEPSMENWKVKLYNDLSMVQQNIDVMNELMSEYPSNEYIPEDVLTLMKDLVSSGLQIQTRLIEIVNASNDEFGETSVLLYILHVNDDLNNSLVQFDRYERCRERIVNKRLSKDELNNRIAKSNLSDTYAAQLEVSDFFEGVSKIQSTEHNLVFSESSSNLIKTNCCLSDDNYFGATKSNVIPSCIKERSDGRCTDVNGDNDRRGLIASQRNNKEREFFDL